MRDTNNKRRILAGVFGLALVLGLAGRGYISKKGEAAGSIVEADETLRDAVASLPPAIAPSVVTPSRVALWASPAMRRAESEKILLSRRQDRAFTKARALEASR